MLSPINELDPDQQRLVERLKVTKLLGALSDDALQSLVSAAQIRTIKFGTQLCPEGQACADLFLVLSGKIRLTAVIGGEEVTIASLGRFGDFFGGANLVPSPGCRFSARASSDSVVLQIAPADAAAIAPAYKPFVEALREFNEQLSQHCLIRSVADFANLQHGQVNSLLAACTAHGFTAGQVIPAEQMERQALCVLLSGAVEVEAPRSGIIHLISSSLLPPDALAAGAQVSAVEETRMLMLSKDSYQQLVEEVPQLEGIFGRLQVVLPVGSDPQAVEESFSRLLAKQAKAEAPSAESPPTPAEKDNFVARLRRRMRNYPHVYQQNSMDCGVACLAMVALFYGKRVNMNQLRTMSGAGRYGTSLLALAETAENLGFVSRGIKATYEGLMKLQMPMICFWKKNHFVVVFELHKDYGIVGDPAEGIIRIDRESFTKFYSGAALEVFPTTDFGKGFSTRSPFLSLWPLMKPYKSVVIDVFVASLFFQALMLAIPLFTQVIVDRVIVHKNLSMLSTMLLGMGVFAVFETVISLLRGFLTAYLTTRMDQSLMVMFYRHLLSLPLKFLQERTTGDLLTRFTENEKIRQFMSGPGLTVILDALIIGVYLAFIFAYNVLYGAAVLFYVVLYTALVVCYTPILKQLSRHVFAKTTEARSFLVESLRAVEKIKASAIETQARWRWEVLFTDAVNCRFQELLAVNTAQTLSRFTNLVGQILLLWLGASLVIDGKLTVGQLMALNILFVMISVPIMRIVEMWDQLQDINIALERMADIIEATPEEQESDKKVQLGRLNGGVKFDGVCFQYSRYDNTNILLNVSFEARPGQTIAIVGRSGAGKSTLLKLIQGLYMPTKGKILIDDHDLAHIGLTSLRRQIGLVSQHEYLFHETIRENVCLYKPDATLQEVVDACKVVGIHDFIAGLPTGYETPLNEGGFNLSGGQRQCLAIARAILHDPKLLILDEATSSMDSDAERLIQASLKKIRENRTVFVVAHRLSTVKDADQILVLDRGQIVERGKHHELMAEKGLYYYLCTQQVNL